MANVAFKTAMNVWRLMRRLVFYRSPPPSVLRPPRPPLALLLRPTSYKIKGDVMLQGCEWTCLVFLAIIIFFVFNVHSGPFFLNKILHI